MTGARRRAGRRLLSGTLSAAAAAATARAAYAGLTRHPPGGEQLWSRTNHRGERVTLLAGPAAAGGAALAAAAAAAPARLRVAAALAAAGAGAFGGYDDLAGSGGRRGFRGHLGALRHGELTTGAVKLGGIGATGLAAAAVLGGTPADVAVNAGLIAGSANLLNLFDLRPGRAIKVTLAAAALLGAPIRPTAAAAAGSGAALLRADLGEKAMLGDAGANALGALIGATAAASLPRGGRLMLLGGIAGLTAASEVVSFTKVIERTPPLRWLDMLGRRPLAPGPRVPAAPAGAAAPTGGGQPVPDARPAAPPAGHLAEPPARSAPGRQAAPFRSTTTT